ncbi:hypothetical protein MYX64_02865 [Nitrospinae bacterium AH_259_B05_G02_I21]|nr:hypothetical protein [Nitrospinae bacterium AH_259_B05_G02_I21]
MGTKPWATLGLLGFLVALGPSQALAADVRFKSEGRASLKGWKVSVPWEQYDGVGINIGSYPSEYAPAFQFDLRGDDLTVDFRNEDFKTPDGFGQGNIAEPRPVTDLEAALDRARRDVHFLYRIWVPGHDEPVGIILTPYQINVTRSGNRITVKLTGEALTLRDVQIKY